MSKQVRLTLIIGVIGSANLFGLIFGPLFWVSSSLHFSEYEDFKKNGEHSEGTVHLKHRHRSFIVSTYDVEVYFQDENKKMHSEDIEVTSILWHHLKMSHEVDVLYKSKNGKIEGAILAASYEDEFLIWRHSKWLGKAMTILAYSLVLVWIALLIRMRQKTKPKRYEKFNEDEYEKLR